LFPAGVVIDLSKVLLSLESGFSVFRPLISSLGVQTEAEK
jgi:hypothetical protein